MSGRVCYSPAAAAGVRLDRGAGSGPGIDDDHPVSGFTLR